MKQFLIGVQHEPDSFIPPKSVSAQGNHLGGFAGQEIEIHVKRKRGQYDRLIILMNEGLPSQESKLVRDIACARFVNRYTYTL